MYKYNTFIIQAKSSKGDPFSPEEALKSKSETNPFLRIKAANHGSGTLFAANHPRCCPYRPLFLQW